MSFALLASSSVVTTKWRRQSAIIGSCLILFYVSWSAKSYLIWALQSFCTVIISRSTTFAKIKMSLILGSIAFHRRENAINPNKVLHLQETKEQACWVLFKKLQSDPHKDQARLLSKSMLKFPVTGGRMQLSQFSITVFPCEYLDSISLLPFGEQISPSTQEIKANWFLLCQTSPLLDDHLQNYEELPNQSDLIANSEL